MNGQLLTETDLKSWTGYERRSDIEALLRKHGVPVIFGRGGQICTTLRALESAIGVRPATDTPSTDTPDFA